MDMRETLLEESGLLQGLLEGREGVLREIRKRYFPMVLDFVIRHGGHHERAEDLYEEGLIALYECVRRPGFELRCKVSTLFYSICRNLYFKGLKNQNHIMVRNEPDMELMDENADIIAAIEGKERMDYFRTVFSRLGPDCQRLLTLAIVEELPVNKIMELMNYGSAGYLYKRKSQCKDKLLDLFKSESNLEQY